MCQCVQRYVVEGPPTFLRTGSHAAWTLGIRPGVRRVSCQRFQGLAALWDLDGSLLTLYRRDSCGASRVGTLHEGIRRVSCQGVKVFPVRGAAQTLRAMSLSNFENL